MQNLTHVEQAKRLIEAIYEEVYELTKAWDDCEHESFYPEEVDDCRPELEAEIERLRQQYDECRAYLVSKGEWKP